MVGAAEGEITAAAGNVLVDPELEGDLQRLLDGRGAVRREQEVRPVDGHDPGQRLGQLDDHTVAVAEHRGVGDAAQLLGESSVELGDPVAEGVYPEGRDGVEVAAPVDVNQLTSLGVVDDYGRVVEIRRHLREPMPHDCRVPLSPTRGHGGCV